LVQIEECWQVTRPGEVGRPRIVVGRASPAVRELGLPRQEDVRGPTCCRERQRPEVKLWGGRSRGVGLRPLTLPAQLRATPRPSEPPGAVRGARRGTRVATGE